jgi:GNAT superfamily N-acetyltransferase
MTSADVAAVAEMHRVTVLDAYAAIFPPDAPKPTLEDLAERWRRILSRGSAWLAAEPEPFGVVGLTREEESGRMESLYVLPSRWGAGVGTRLADIAETEAVRRGWLPLRLWVLEANARARAWYEFRGWELEPGRRRTVWGEVDEVGYRFRDRPT